jgi:hypothetical protein
VDHTEDGGVGADAQPDNQNRDYEKPDIAAETSKGIAHILRQVIPVHA